jgi:hypothetical protein
MGVLTITLHQLPTGAGGWYPLHSYWLHEERSQACLLQSCDNGPSPRPLRNWAASLHHHHMCNSPNRSINMTNSSKQKSHSVSHAVRPNGHVEQGRTSQSCAYVTRSGAHPSARCDRCRARRLSKLCRVSHQRAARERAALCAGARCARTQHLHIAGHHHGCHACNCLRVWVESKRKQSYNA